MQVWPVSGHGPSQVGAIESLHGIGSQLHVAVPVVKSGRQTVPCGHGPSQVGYGDRSHGIGTHSQEAPAALPWQIVPGGQSPSQVG